MQRIQKIRKEKYSRALATSRSDDWEESKARLGSQERDEYVKDKKMGKRAAHVHIRSAEWC